MGMLEYSSEPEGPNTSVHVPHAKFKTDLRNVPPTSKIEFVGRHATWKHWHKADDVVFAAQNKYALQRMYNRQLRFNLNFMDYNSRSPKILIEQTREYVLYAMAELYEVLDAVEWKKWQGGGKYSYDRAALIEELVDVQKFLYGLMNLWGVTDRELVEEFHRKSAIVEEKHELRGSGKTGTGT